MANRRMFSMDVVDTDSFLDMPVSAQCLYFHLGMRADDDGFVSSPRKITGIAGCNVDDLKILISKQFVIPFESGVVVIADWKVNNYLRADRYKPTRYTEELQQLLCKGGVYCLDTIGIPNDIPMGNPGKDRLGKDSIGKEKEIVSKDTIRCTDVQLVAETWNSIGISQITGIKPETIRYKMLKARIREYGIDQVLQAVENIKLSSFLKGSNVKGWEIKFDWFVKPNNFLKVLEGNYSDKGDKAAENVWEEWRNEQE